MLTITFYLIMLLPLSYPINATGVFAARPKTNTRTNMYTHHPMHRVICVYNSKAKHWGNKYSFGIDDINSDVCTHIFYHQVHVKDINNISTTMSCSYPEQYDSFTYIKYDNPQLRFFLTVGDEYETWDLEKLVTNETHVEEFITSLTMLLRLCHFNGLNLNFKVTPSTSVAFTDLIRRLQEAFEEDDKLTNQPKLELAATVFAPTKLIGEVYQVSNISSKLDQLIILSFEDNCFEENKVTMIANRLYSEENRRQSAMKKDGEKGGSYHGHERDDNSVEAKLDQWIHLGADRSKINLALSLVGRGYLLKSASRHGIGDPVKELSEKTKTHREGHINYNELCVKMKEGGELVRVSKKDDTPYWYHDKLWVNFEDEKSLLQKVHFLRSRNLLGVSLMSQAEDDFTGDFCGGEDFVISKKVYEASDVEEYIESIPPVIELSCN